jgi:hypothetical protein
MHLARQDAFPSSSPPVRLRLRPIDAPPARRTVVAAVRSQPTLPSLVAALSLAIVRARGDEASFLELAPEVGEWEDALVPALLRPTDRILLLDAPPTLRALPTTLGDIPVVRELRAIPGAADQLEAPPVPDFSDYPVSRTRVLPIALRAPSGRHRKLAETLHEIREYARRHATPDLVFVDHAVNAIPGFLGELVAAIQTHAPGIQWMAAVALDGRHETPTRRTIRAAALAGLRVLVIRADGSPSDDASLAELCRHAADAGIAVRVDRNALRRGAGPTGPAGGGDSGTVFDSIALKD